jgi:hypothetical protein
VRPACLWGDEHVIAVLTDTITALASATVAFSEAKPIVSTSSRKAGTLNSLSWSTFGPATLRARLRRIVHHIEHRAGSVPNGCRREAETRACIFSRTAFSCTTAGATIV